MNRETPYPRVFTWALSALLSTCLVLGMLPTSAFGTIAVPSGTERPTIVSEEVALAPDSVDEDSLAMKDAAGADVSEETDQAGEQGESGSIPVGDAQTSSGQTKAEVPIADGSTTQKTLLVDGLEYSADTETETAALVGWYGEAPLSDLVVPSHVSDGATKYAVDAIGFPVDEASDKNRDASRKAMGGA